MREYWEIIKADTGMEYTMSHMLMSVASIGGAQLRHRYFWVAHRVPFGMAYELPGVLTTLEYAVKDLEDTPQLWEPQDYTSPASSAYAEDLRGSAVMNHESIGGKAEEAMRVLLPYWPQGKAIHTATKNFIEAHGGTVELKSAKGKGTHVTITIPRGDK